MKEHIKISLIVLISVFVTVATIIVVGFFYIKNVRHNIALEKEKHIKTITDDKFIELNTIMIQNDSIKNIATLPKDQYLVINGIVINIKKRCFGSEPYLGFYNSYYENGDSAKYKNLNYLLDSLNTSMDSVALISIISRMKKFDIIDISREKRDTLLIVYRWKASAMNEEEGLIYTLKRIERNTANFRKIEKVGKDFYYFIN
jgi:hypothetical protein